MSLNAPAAAAVLAQEVALPRTPSPPPPAPSTLERLAGPEGSSRRTTTWYLSSLLLATCIRVLCFTPGVLGNYLLKTLGPVEREEVHWRWIVGVRAWDLLMARWVWTAVKGEARKDGALFGALLMAVSRIPLYAFEHSYFLLSTETISTVLLTDIVSIASACTLLPILLPHSVEGHSPVSIWQRLTRNQSLAINLFLSFALATTSGAFGGYVLERLGGTSFVQEHVYEVVVPSFLSADTMTAAQMMARPTIPVPVLRSDLAPQSMPTHLLHSAFQALLAIPLTTILPSLAPLGLSLLALLLVTPSSTLLLHAVLPISFTGAAGAGIALGLRAAMILGLVAWVLEELRGTTMVERVEQHKLTLLVDETDKVVGIIEEDVVLEKKTHVELTEEMEEELEKRAEEEI